MIDFNADNKVIQGKTTIILKIDIDGHYVFLHGNGYIICIISSRNIIGHYDQETPL